MVGEEEATEGSGEILTRATQGRREEIEGDGG